MIKWIKGITIDLLNTTMVLIVMVCMMYGRMFIDIYGHELGYTGDGLLNVYTFFMAVGYGYVILNWSSKLRVLDLLDQCREGRKSHVQPIE